MIPYSEAYEIIYRNLQPLKNETEIVSIYKAAGRTLAEDIIADTDLPPFTNSAMDGFAVRYQEGRNTWKIEGEITAGNYRIIQHSDDSAVHIMTGAEVPPGFDTVVPVENVHINENTITLTGSYRKGENVRPKGDDLALNSTAVKKDTFLKPQHIALAAACGKTEIKVWKSPVIGILATGDELIDPSLKPEGDKIRATNNVALYSAAAEAGCVPFDLGIVKDDPVLIKTAILKALASDINMLITTGGVSVGKSDFVKTILAEAGVDIKFRKINIKPGKPVVFGIYSGNGKLIPVIGLPGNPVSSLVVFNIFIRDILLKIFGGKGLTVINAILKNSIRKNDDKRHFERGLIETDGHGNYFVSALKKQSSGNMVQMSSSGCLIILPEQCSGIKEGESVRCILI